MNKLFVILVLITGLSLAACGGGDSVRETGTVSGKQVLVGIGASDAVGIGSTDPERDNWVAQLAQRLPAGSRAINLGISSAEASRALEQELPVALDAQPTLAVVWLGANDVQDGVSLPIFGQNLAQLLHGLRADGQTRVYVANLPDLRLLPA
ncbi:MAG: GDSL-type esterase/lipase family protein, partial [Dehalococcoidia bacterium]